MQNPKLIFSIIFLNYCASFYLYIYIAINISANFLHQIRLQQTTLSENDENDDDDDVDDEDLQLETWETDENEQHQNFIVIDEDFLHFRIRCLLEKVNRMIEGRPLENCLFDFIPFLALPFRAVPDLLFEIVHPPRLIPYYAVTIIRAYDRAFFDIEIGLERPIFWETMSIDEFRQLWEQLSKEEELEYLFLCYNFGLNLLRKISKKFVRLIFDPGSCQ